jgi:bifunctional N-acetylglucosamine-1-phosphate-uridyltransferase/glucosamine-1-phosphate-acetyltransferase GlmU-like protein
MNNERKLGAIILAAGQGKRMQSTDKNKVTLPLGNKPLILHSIHLLEKMQFSSIVVVVGFAKESVIELLENSAVDFAEQKDRLGTAHAVQTGIEKVPSEITDVLVMQGDDSHFYTEKIINELIAVHTASDVAVTMLTVDVENSIGLGRIVRDEKGNVLAVVEEKDATDEQKAIHEVNPACYLFSVSFLKKYLPQVEKSPVTGEYYLTSLIDLAIKHGERVDTLKGGKMAWRGVNTKEELQEAERLYAQIRD